MKSDVNITDPVFVNVKDVKELIKTLDGLPEDEREEIIKAIVNRYVPFTSGLNVIIGGNNVIFSKVGLQNNGEKLSDILSHIPQDSLEHLLKAIILALEVKMKVDTS